MLKPQNNLCRTTISLDGIWEFTTNSTGTPQNGFIPQGTIAVPASWNEQHTALFHYHGALWYQTAFEAPEIPAGKELILRCAGLLYHGAFYLNGKKLGEDSWGLMPIEFEITKRLIPGENRLSICVWGTNAPNQPIGHGDFYDYAGIHRPVTLEIRSRKHIVSLRANGDTQGKLSIDFATVGGTSLKFTIGDIQKSFSLPEAHGSLHISHPKLWDCENPYLYPLTAELFDGKKLVDRYTMKIGFRSIAVKGRNILLNGKKITLQGFGRHEDFAILGKGMNQALNNRDYQLMKWCGANSFRTSHYPYSEEMMELADRWGFLVIDEFPYVEFKESHFTNQKLCKNAVDFAKLVIQRDASHPSVIAWSMGNECITDIPEAVPFFKKLIDTVRKEDPTRLVTYVTARQGTKDLVVGMTDFIGLNRYFGWYDYSFFGNTTQPGDLHSAIRELNESIEEFTSRHKTPLVITEFGADCVPGLHSAYNQMFSEEFQCEFLRRYINCFKQRKDVAGMMVWNFADFSTGQNPLRVCGNKKGVFTRSREPKQAAFLLRSLWRPGEDSQCPALGEPLPKNIRDF